jgi:hypothetical protein
MVGGVRLAALKAMIIRHLHKHTEELSTILSSVINEVAARSFDFERMRVVFLRLSLCQSGLCPANGT